jgi:DNA-binding transcriptional ArsR family regulator
MDGPILELLEEYGSLGYERITALVGAPPQVVRSALAELLESGLVDVVSVGEVQGHKTEAAVYWRLTEEGRQELVRRRSE